MSEKWSVIPYLNILHIYVILHIHTYVHITIGLYINTSICTRICMCKYMYKPIHTYAVTYRPLQHIRRR
jgi:hypothetical protein